MVQNKEARFMAHGVCMNTDRYE